MATSQTRQPAPLRRKANVSRSAFGAQARAFTRSGQSGSRDTRTPGFEISPGHRITSPGSGNARKLAGLRCGLVMRWPPKLVWPLAGQANSSLPPQPDRPEARKRDPAPHDEEVMPDMYPAA